jgi:hypothetical protein
MTTRPLPAIVLTLILACTHSEAFPTAGYQAGPGSTGPDVLLTYSADQNYWPILTEDGSGVLYAFIDPAASRIPSHRCIGLLPVAGGTRFWQWCDNRGTQRDSSNSFAAYALGADGRLLYVESVVPNGFPFQTQQVALWLADSASPFRRRSLATLPVVVGDSTINWIADLSWTGPNTFLGLGQRYLPAPRDSTVFVDSVFRAEVLVRGTINDQGAALVAVPGTAGATGYSLAEGGASIVFTQIDDVNLMKVPTTGGVPTVVGPATPRTGVQLLGVSCRGTTCVVALGPARLRPLTGTRQLAGSGPFELRSVSLVTGAATTLLSRSQVLSSPLLLASGDVVAQVGAGNGRFGSIGAPAGSFQTLHLYKALVP